MESSGTARDAVRSSGLEGRAGSIDVVTDHVRVARGFHLGSVIHVSTLDGPIVIDTTGSRASAARARRALSEVDARAPSWIVYTHCHPDHCGGAAAFESDALQGVVAHELLPELRDRDHRCLDRWHHRIRAWQRGLPEEAGYEYQEDGGSAFIEPSVTFADRLDLEVGGVEVVLEHTEGETRDHLLAWIPSERVLCPGDLFYAAFPNLSSPAIGPRPVRGWIRSLDRMLELDADHLVPSHTAPVSGRERVRSVLTAYRDAIEHLWVEVERALNDGVHVDDAVDRIRLPAHLATRPELQEHYGTVAWGVRAIYDGLTGWYDGNPATLNPRPAAERSADLVELAGADALVARARARHEEGRHQLALELASVVLADDPLHPGANQVCRVACRALGEAATSMNELGFYVAGARAAKHRMQLAEEAAAPGGGSDA